MLILLSLDINHIDIIAMVVSLERRIESHGGNNRDREQQFYSHTLQYLISTSGQQVTLEEWMISSFNVEFGTEIGAGGLWVK
jgi:hypothetical protein